MKHTFLTLSLFLFIGVSAYAVKPAGDDAPKPVAVYDVPMPADMVITAEDILAYKPKELGKKYGVKFNLKQRAALTIARGKLKKAEKRGEDVNEAFSEMASAEGGGWHWGGFFFGLILGLLGWLIAILIWPKQGAGRAALVGILIWVAVILIFTL